MSLTLRSVARRVVVALALGAPGTAFAASDIGCIATHLTAQPVARIGGRVVDGIDNGTKNLDWLADDRDAVIAARNTCRKANGWSNDATDSAMNYFQAQSALAGVEPRFASDKLDAAALRQAYAAMPESDRRSVVVGDALTPNAEKVMRGFAGQRGDPAYGRRLNHVLIFMGSLSGMEFYPAQFSAL